MRWIAEALVARGAEVTFVTGGRPLPGRMPLGCAIVQLPFVEAADPSFAVLVGADGRPLDDALRTARSTMLQDAHARARPHVVVLETFPFGRRALRFELEPLLATIEATRPRPRVVASVRDLLQRRDDPARDAQAWAVAQRHVDEILVHGDPAFARLEETFPPAADGTVPVSYTGYVRAPAPVPAPRERAGVVIAASGGGEGLPLLRAAIAARASSALRDASWRVLAGGGVSDAAFASLVAEGAARGVRVERHRADFAELLAGAHVAVTQAGYNTVLDVLVARARSVLVPFEAHGETEQRMRAERLAAQGRAMLVRERDLSPAALARAVDLAAKMPEPAPCPYAIDGAARAAERVLALARSVTAAP
ncbi:MAG TPA: glycosyltransferase [Casimicrobiaceae bacterium]|nr:glycosyltransferase [Casimicrobiaceae bacterium]